MPSSGSWRPRFGRYIRDHLLTYSNGALVATASAVMGIIKLGSLSESAMRQDPKLASLMFHDDYDRRSRQLESGHPVIPVPLDTAAGPVAGTPKSPSSPLLPPSPSLLVKSQESTTGSTGDKTEQLRQPSASSQRPGSVAAGKVTPCRSQHPHTRHPGFITQQHVDLLRKDGIVVIDDILSLSQLKSARDDVTHMLETDFNQKNNSQDTDIAIRQDLVCWIHEAIGAEQINDLGDGLLYAVRCVRSVAQELVVLEYEKSSNLGVPFVNQLACYDGGARYIAHRDTPEAYSTSWNHPLRFILHPGLSARVVTIILYINEPEWDTARSGGSLRCYMNADNDDFTGSTATDIRDVIPHGGRLVIFDSRRILHEVMPSSSRRTAITCWIGGDSETSNWLRPFCIPYEQIHWPSMRKRWWWGTSSGNQA
jgi:2OG-Fe(II) oxygenase superfamily